MVLGISSGGIEGACQTGFRDLEGPSTTQLKSQPYLQPYPLWRYSVLGRGLERRAFFGSDLSQFRKTVMKLDAAPVGPTACHLHGCTQRTAASATI